MIDIHLTRELLQAVTRGELHPSVLTATLLEHLTALCPTCRDEIDAWRRDARGSGSEGVSAAVDKSLASADAQQRAIERERREARKDFTALLRLPEGRRLERVTGAYKRFRSPFLAEELLRKSRSFIPADPRQAFHFAELANTVAQWSQNRAFGAELQTQALANMANAQRALGELRTADALFRQARSVVRMEGVTDKLVYAELDSYEGTLRRVQRSFDEAETLFERAVLHSRLAGDDERVARTLLSISELYRAMGESEKALVSAREALELLDPEEQARLCLMARHNVAHSLCDLERFEPAAAAFDEAKTLYARFEDFWTQQRADWLEGKILRGLGRPRDAETVLRGVRERFVTQDEAYDAALVSIDLALVMADLGRSHDMQVLAEEMMPLFQAVELHREAMATLLLFQQAVRENALTGAMVREMGRFMEQARRNFEQSSPQPS
ncbi:MAG: tetratricopeptide repeat protein [Acidobacteriota bacterium]